MIVFNYTVFAFAIYRLLVYFIFSVVFLFIMTEAKQIKLEAEISDQKRATALLGKINILVYFVTELNVEMNVIFSLFKSTV